MKKTVHKQACDRIG